MLEEGFELELEAGLTQDRVFVGLGGPLEEDALIIGGLPDGFEFVEPQEAGERKGIPAVMLVGIVADKTVAAGIANDDLLDDRLEEPAEPASEVGFFEHETFNGGRNGLDMFEELLGISRETPVIDFVALIVELSQNAVFGVGIQAEPCYRGSVIHNKPLVVVNVLNNLADAWRIRICSFTESHNCSIQQVVRFSIYQQATRDGVSSSASRFALVDPACLSFGR